MEIFNQVQKNIAGKIDASAILSNWKDWRWHRQHSIRDLETFQFLTGIQFTEKEISKYERTVERFPISITPYYLSLINTKDYRNDPVFKQAFPNPGELIISQYDMEDPLFEEEDSPVPGLTHRYPDRVLFHINNVCAMYCRHCTRKRKVGDVDSIPNREELQLGINYIRDHPEVRDVLLSGGDPLMLPNDQLEWILKQIHRIEHVEIVRIGTRMPVVLPYRIDEDLVQMLKKYQPIWINTHFNHPRELTSSSKESLARLADAGFPLGNQTVLLAGVNDCPRIMKRLNQKLLVNRVRPYYLYQCDLSEGLSHFRTPVGKGIEILENLIGHTSGLAVPTFVIDAPGGGGKIPLTPNYLISLSTNRVVLRNYKGILTTYKEPDSYEPVFCDRRCDRCELQLDLTGAVEDRALGIAQLLSDADDTIAVVPQTEISSSK